jgi:hypothetical protein
MSETVGGPGGRNSWKKRKRREREKGELEALALAQFYTVGPEVRDHVIDKLDDIVKSSGSSAREVTAAARAILAASKVNLSGVSMTIKAQTHEVIEPALAQLKRQAKKCLGRPAGTMPVLSGPSGGPVNGPSATGGSRSA